VHKLSQRPIALAPPSPEASTAVEEQQPESSGRSPRYRAGVASPVPFPPVIGTVEVWHDEEGWGVLRTPDGLSVFCHFSNIEIEGFADLTEGTPVWFDYMTPGQDGCDASVLTAARPDAARTEVPLGQLIPKKLRSRSAFVSQLKIKFDGDR
jgi:CspA family cold shock protein